MDNSKTNFDDFLLLLEKQSLKKPSALYDKVVNTNEQTDKPQDVVKTVYSQIKAICLADCAKRVPKKSDDKSINKANKAQFLPVNKLPVYPSNMMQEGHKTDANKFETQCVSDTQLINIIDNAVAIETNRGMTQEFDITFTHIDDNNDDQKAEKENEASPEPLKESNSKHEDCLMLVVNKSIVTKNKQNIEEMIVTEESQNSILESSGASKLNIIDGNFQKLQIGRSDLNQKENLLITDVKSQSSKTAEDAVTSIKKIPNTQDDELKEIHNNEPMDIDTGQDKQRSPRPVLNTNIRKRKRTPSPLVVSLESFENFENIAIPLIEENADFDTAKHLINSQILGKELCLNSNANIILDIERNHSPVLEFKSDELQINSKDLMTSPVKKIINNDVLLSDVTEKPDEILKDEILFSSDEEIDYIHKDLQDLPLTCALESSFCDQAGVLDETVFVGFQTASNKSIQVFKESFEEAHSILDDETIEKFSLSELVEKCDNLNSKHEKSVNSKANITQANETIKTIAVESKPDLVQSENNLANANEKEPDKNKNDTTNEYLPSKQQFNGFMTANNKKIKMSDKALERCHKVFKDIDLNENFNTIEIEKTAAPAVEKETCINETEKNPNCDKNIEENTIEDRINDELLLQEFENIEMSLEEKETSNKVEPEGCEGFKTASNKPIKISKEAMAKTMRVFKNVDAELDVDYNTEDVLMKSPVKEHTSGIMKEFMDFEMGFKTASNKTLAKTQNTFGKIGTDNVVETIEDINQPSTSKAVFVGFKTANNKEIKISEEALSNTKNVFKDIGKEKPKIKPIEVIEQQSTSKVAFLGFKTANNKVINISDEAISKTKSVFKDIDKETSKIEKVQVINKLSSNKFVFDGFKTANNKDIKISDIALSKSKNLYKDVDKEIPLEFEIDERESNGFKTENNKIVTVSEKALIKSRNLFQDIDMNENIDKPDDFFKRKALLTDLDAKLDGKMPYVDDSKDVNPLDTGFKGFQTASKKPVLVSADGIARSKKLFQDIDEINENIPENIPINISNAGFRGFQTANKKPVEVSREAVIASKKLFEDSNDGRKTNSESTFVGFKTANNKHVNISKEALAKCKKVFDGIEDIPIAAQSSSKSKIYEQNIDFNNPFQTANNERVKISKEGLEKAKNIFDDVESNSNNKELGFTFKEFQTTSHQKVSEQALAKSKLFLDINTETDITNAKKDEKTTDDVTASKEANKATKVTFGFQTGNNKQIQVSEDALKKSKKLLADNISDKEKSRTLETKENNFKEIGANETININSILNTQVLNNFNEDLCTEDFKVIPSPNKRSGSPILSCPKAKRRKKFETPYNLKPKIVNFNKEIDEDKKPANLIKFKADYKKNKKYTLEDLKKLENDNTKDVDPYILSFNLENILNFQFDKSRNDLNDGKMDIKEIKRLFVDATEKKLIPEGWMDIHLKLILWKLISYEIKFPNTLHTVCTVRNVIDQLKYRYDKELYNAERPILRKILEKDDVASKTMVLCVAGVYVDGVSVASATNLTNVELLLTDGWYFVKATIDNMLSKLVYHGKIVVGSKLVTCGAELVNCEQGVSPWEDTSSIRLSITSNGTRLAPWSAKLGLRPVTIVSRLGAITAGGGRVPRLRGRVARVYPRLYVERFQDGSTVTRSERLELQYQIKYEAEREAMIEKIYEEVEKEFFDQESQDSDSTLEASGKRRCYHSGSQIAKLMKTSKDPMEFRAQLTSTQIQLLQDHVSKQRDRYLQAIQDRVQERLRPRNVVTLARGRIADVKRDGNTFTVTKGMLSIWKPNDEVLDIFKEGSWFEVTNVVPTAFRNAEIQLSAGRQSVFRPVKCKEEIIEPYLESLKRTCYNIKDLCQNPAMTIDYNEIDTVGMIFSIDPPIREFESIKSQFQNLYLADIDKNIICVIFWGGIKKFGYENVLDTGQVIYCGNLQKRAGNTRKNVPQYRATEFSLFTKTPKSEKARQMIEEMNKKMNGLDRRKFCDDCITVKQNYSAIKCFNDSENVTPYRFNKSDYNLGRNKMFIDTPSANVKPSRKADDFNLSGLDFESTFKQQDTQLSPRTLLRKKKVNEKIAKLKMYGEPPPLSPMNIINKSVNAASSYKSPLLLKNEGIATPNKTSITSANNLENVTTPTKVPDEHVDSEAKRANLDYSPIILMNKTYVKRCSVNPVKLNFCESVAIDKNTIDNFAEDLDGSPPLSLD